MNDCPTPVNMTNILNDSTNQSMKIDFKISYPSGSVYKINNLAVVSTCIHIILTYSRVFYAIFCSKCKERQTIRATNKNCSATRKRLRRCYR